jgi:hypothetical protein
MANGEAWEIHTEVRMEGKREDTELKKKSVFCDKSSVIL